MEVEKKLIHSEVKKKLRKFETGLRSAFNRNR